jgi:hypothetical protein
MAVGDVAEWQMQTYWSFTSTPVSGYEGNLWSHWSDVLSVQQELLFNGDKEILFDTYSDSDLMGYLTLESKMKMEEVKSLIFRGRFGWKFTYGGVRTLGSVEIFDLTSQSTVWKKDIKSNGVVNVMYWSSFASPIEYPDILNLDKDHDYVIRLKAKDVWSGQKVRVVWESAEVWFYSPDYRTLRHYKHDWTLPGDYRCYVQSRYNFRTGPLDDMLREHRPYVLGGGLPWGWNPCYLHEFRSEPYTKMEYDLWWTTTMPGVVDHTWSDLGEQEDDGYDEVEIYSKNPELFWSLYTYDTRIRFVVLETGDVDVTVESELGNENDWYALFDPPAYPVAYIELIEKTFTHSYSSSPQYQFKALAMMESHNETQSIDYSEDHDWFYVRVVGEYPEFLDIYTRINEDLIHTPDDLESLIAYMKRTALNDIEMMGVETKIPATITFNGIQSVEDIVDFVARFELDVRGFSFTATDGKSIMRGEGTPSDTEIIPLDDLRSFITDYDLVGIHGIDVIMNGKVIEQLVVDEMIAVLNFLGFSALRNANIDPASFTRIRWFTEDPSWYLNHAFSE